MRQRVSIRDGGNSRGFTLVELLVALGLTGIIGAVAMKFYANVHNQSITQQNISDMQQNLRASLDEITRQLKNAGASLPSAIPCLMSDNTDPDTLLLRYAPSGGAVEVGNHTQIKQANPIHVAKGSDLSRFSVGQQVYLWHESLKKGEWFTITAIATNNGSGWEEIHHQSANLLFDPMPGDLLIAMRELQYFIDRADTTRPMLMCTENGGAPQIFADNVYDMQLRYYLSNLDTVDVLTPTDTVYVVRLSLASQTEQRDYDAEHFGNEGRRHRTLTTEVLVRNRRFGS